MLRRRRRPAARAARRARRRDRRRRSSCRPSCCAQLGVVPSYYLRYFYAHDEVVREQLAAPSRAAAGGRDRARAAASCTPTRRSTRSRSCWRSAAARSTPRPPCSWPRRCSASGDATSTQVVNLRNDGTLPFLPDDAVDRGARRRSTAPGVRAAAGRAARAAVRRAGRRTSRRTSTWPSTPRCTAADDRVFEALLAHPLVGQVDLADGLTDRLIAHNRDYLPWA